MNRKQAADSPRKPSLVVRRSVVIAGRKTGVSLEGAFWNALKEIAISKNVSVSDLLAAITNEHGEYLNLSSVIRLFVLQYFRGLVSNRTARR